MAVADGTELGVHVLRRPCELAPHRVLGALQLLVELRLLGLRHHAELLHQRRLLRGVLSLQLLRLGRAASLRQLLGLLLPHLRLALGTALRQAPLQRLALSPALHVHA